LFHIVLLEIHTPYTTTDLLNILFFFSGIADGAYTFVFASPESVLKPAWRSIFLNDIWQARLKLLVFDEAHCLSEWGEDFRPNYLEMCQLRSFFNVPVMALTATSTAKIKEDIMAILQLEPEKRILFIDLLTVKIFLSHVKKNHQMTMKKNFHG